MRLDPYRRVLARPGVRSLLVVTLLARIPLTAAPVVLTLHVVLGLHRGFTQSGSVAALSAVGMALGAPVVGRGIDRFGLRPVLVLTTIAQGLFWSTARSLPYVWLLVAGLVAGTLALPVFTVARQALAALVPPQERQAGFSLDSMSVEISYAIGPALGVLTVTQAGSEVAFLGAAVLIVLSGVALVRLDPPVRGEDGVPPEPGRSRPVALDPPPVRSWLGPRVGAVLLATFGATFTLAGTDVALTAVMRSFHAVGLLGLVFAIWCLASLAGGFVYGMAHRGVDPLVLLALLAGLTVPVALAGSWWTLALLVIPTGLFCAPLISSTAELLTRLTPATVRGQVMGLHASALTVGNALGAPLVGLLVDHLSPRSGFVGVGVLGLLLALGGLLASSLRRTARGRSGRPAQPEPVVAGASVGQEA